jgi:hypothetical protein
MIYENKILIGGQALREMGSSRYTNDVDYLVFDENSFEAFIFDKDNNIDYMNGNASNFAESIYNKEKGNNIATPQSLFELKAFSLLSHLRNFNAEKINTTIFDLNFLAINFEIDMKMPTLSKFITANEVSEIIKEIRTKK